MLLCFRNDMRREKLDVVDEAAGGWSGERGEACRSRSAREELLENNEFKPTGFRPDEFEFEFEVGSFCSRRRAYEDEEEAGTAGKVMVLLLDAADLVSSSCPLAPPPFVPCGDGTCE